MCNGAFSIHFFWSWSGISNSTYFFFYMNWDCTKVCFLFVFVLYLFKRSILTHSLWTFPTLPASIWEMLSSVNIDLWAYAKFLSLASLHSALASSFKNSHSSLQCLSFTTHSSHISVLSGFTAFPSPKHRSFLSFEFNFPSWSNLSWQFHPGVSSV